MNKGLFISFEGLDGSGKTTQINLLYKFLLSKNLDVLMLREPGGTFISEKIRELLINYDMSPYTEALLYAAARAELVNSNIKNAIEEKKIVLCDRFLDSSIAYQGYARNLGSENIYNINKFGINDLMPDLTFFMDISPEESLFRRTSAAVPDRIESEKIEFHHKVYQGYLDLCLKFPKRIHKINALGNADYIHNEIIDIIINFI